MTSETEFRWTSAARTDVGMFRSKNEDACIDRPQQGLWAVADGMGGHAFGDFASRTVVSGLEQLAQLASSDELAARIDAARDRLQATNRQLCAEAPARGVQIIGSTVAVLIASKRRCGYLWAGDSRLYLYRNRRLIQLTRDHSQFEEFRAIHPDGLDELLPPPARNLITRAIGAADMLELDDGMLDVDDGDMFLLCSDGLSNEVDEQEIADALEGGDCRRAADALIELALEHGGRDNVTVVVVRAEDMQEKTVLNPAL